MSTAYVIATIVGAAMIAFSAGAVLLRAEWVVRSLTDAAIAVVLYFVGAVITVVRARAYSHIGYPLMYMAPVLGVLVLMFASGIRLGA